MQVHYWYQSPTGFSSFRGPVISCPQGFTGTTPPLVSVIYLCKSSTIASYLLVKVLYWYKLFIQTTPLPRPSWTSLLLGLVLFWDQTSSVLGPVQSTTDISLLLGPQQPFTGNQSSMNSTICCCLVGLTTATKDLPCAFWILPSLYSRARSRPVDQ